jgi:hypothetical protein
MRNTVSGAKLVQPPRTFDAMPSFERSGRIVDSGVNHLAVMRARGHAGARLFLEHAYAATAASDSERRRKTDDAASDYRGVYLFHALFGLVVGGLWFAA